MAPEFICPECGNCSEADYPYCPECGEAIPES